MKTSSLGVAVVLALAVPGAAVAQDGERLVALHDRAGDIADLDGVRMEVDGEDLVVTFDLAEPLPDDLEWTSPAESGAVPGCGPATEPLDVDRDFRPAGDSRPDAPPPWPILGSRVDGEATTIEAARAAGLPALELAGHPNLASAIHFRSGRRLVTYLSREPLSEDDTFVDLYADGGAFLSEGPSQGEPMVALMRDRLGDEGAGRPGRSVRRAPLPR